MAKRSLTVAGHRTSVSVEEPFWAALEEIAAAEGTSVSALVRVIDAERDDATSLSAALRAYALDWYRSRAPAAVRAKARAPSGRRRRRPPARD